MAKLLESIVTPPPSIQNKVTATVELDRKDIVLLRFMFLDAGANHNGRPKIRKLMERINNAADESGVNGNFTSDKDIEWTFTRLHDVIAKISFSNFG